MSAEDRPEIPLDEEDLSLSSERERASLLASVMKHDAERKEARAFVEPPRTKPLAPQLVALAFSTVLAVYVWFGSPSWLGPQPVPLPPLAEEGSAVRTVVWLGAQQVEAFQARNGRIPSSHEVGPLPLGVLYERLDAQSYIIARHGGRVGISYSSGEPMDDLLEAVEALLTEVDTQ